MSSTTLLNLPDAASQCLFDVGQPKLRPVTVSGGVFVHGDTEEDWCDLEFTTQDAVLIKKLKTLCKRRNKVVMRVEQKVRELSLNDLDVKDSPVLMLTYPHGRQCHATLGRLKKVDVKEEWRRGWTTSVYYSTDSCPGSSGGLVLPVARLGSGNWYKSLLTHPHSGADDQ